MHLDSLGGLGAGPRQELLYCVSDKEACSESYPDGCRGWMIRTVDRSSAGIEGSEIGRQVGSQESCKSQYGRCLPQWDTGALALPVIGTSNPVLDAIAEKPRVRSTYSHTAAELIASYHHAPRRPLPPGLGMEQ